MTERRNPGEPPEQQADGQPENVRELQDPSSGAAQSAEKPEKPEKPESAMGGTSDAGTAADDAAEAANFDIGLPDDRTRRHG